MEGDMSKTPKKKSQGLAAPSSSPAAGQPDFDVVLGLIETARTQAVTAFNTTLIDLYWRVGEYISRQIAADGWGQGTVQQLADYIQVRQPNAGGFSGQNLWRMRQFFETYRDQPILSTLSRELPWSHNLAILSRSNRDEEREDVRKPYEQPSIGLLLCATKDRKVVEYALSRSASPALVAEYQTRLPDKKLLQAKLQEFYEQAETHAEPTIAPPAAAQLPKRAEDSPAKQENEAKQAKQEMNAAAMTDPEKLDLRSAEIEAVKAGATAVIEPGGSVRDDEVIKAANENNIAMVFTGIRHFKH